MADDEPPEIDDETLILRMMDGDRDAVVDLLKAYGGRVKGYLIETYGQVLHGPTEIEAALNQAALNVWRFAHRYDPSKGTLKGWFLKIARNAARSIIKDNRKHLAKDLEYEPTYDPADDDDDPHDQIDGRKRQQLEDLDYVIEHKLQGLQRAIIKADLACGGLADAGRLARIHNTSKNSIHVSRNKAKENIRKHMLEIESQRQRTKK